MRLIDSQLMLCRRQCEERRQYVAELERLATRLRGDCGRLRAQTEEAVSDSDVSAAAALIERHGKVERSLAAIEEQIVAAGAAAAEAEQELRRREQAFATRSPAERRGPALRSRHAAASPPGPDRGG